MIDFVATYIFFFAVIDPIGTVPVFIAVTNRFNPAEKRKIAIRATLIAAGVLLFFVVAGEIILDAINIPLPAFQIAGGVVLFMFALTMIFGESKAEGEIKTVNKINDIAVFPLAMPSLASPGAMLVAVLLTKNADFSILHQMQTSFMMLAVLMTAFFFMLIAAKINKLIGDGGANIISRVMGLILTAVAVTNVLEGITEYFSL